MNKLSGGLLEAWPSTQDVVSADVESTCHLDSETEVTLQGLSGHIQLTDTLANRMLLKMGSSPPDPGLRLLSKGQMRACRSFLQGDGQLVLCGVAAPHVGSWSDVCRSPPLPVVSQLALHCLATPFAFSCGLSCGGLPGRMPQPDEKSMAVCRYTQVCSGTCAGVHPGVCRRAGRQALQHVLP